MIVWYLIACNEYSLQHVGETVQKLNKGNNWHKTDFSQSSKYGFCRILSDHFHIKICNIFRNTTYSVQILKENEITFNSFMHSQR